MSIKSHWLKLFGGLLCLLFASVAVLAQSVSGTISGAVLDASGQVIAGAKVTLIEDRTGSARTAATNREGDFTFTTLIPGVYTIKIEQNGFRSYQRTNNVLSANEV